MTQIREGLTYVPGRGTQTAKALLEAADKVGAPRESVKTQLRGYIVPEAVATEYSKPKRLPTRSKKGTN